MPVSERHGQKTFYYDGVFGPDVAQQGVFDSSVVPVLTEVMEGYNCTIFCYGQTGSGKTYTMEGDLAVQAAGAADEQDAALPDLSERAGIIPRALYRIFEMLESQRTEYTVRVSFIELYNEELKDLLCCEEDPKRLRLFEDSSRKGIVIQGIEEAIIPTAADGVALLMTGSNKRRSAATKMNENSSRSHCIFSLTVHIKESTPEGEDLLKVGKLNLVDLAGSENIGRSGAVLGRAREAGMINQSLLTLGRVINALTEHSPHVPYRESKLTRLLQDSLGGRAKTTIIATISPAKCNIEETISTLEYASRAKSIKNRPEVNQRLTKKALIKEYIMEIERLKNDLQAARDKHGVYLSQEAYKQLLDENQSRKDQIDELTKRQEALQESQTRLDEKYTETCRELDERTGELAAKRAAYSELEGRFAELDGRYTATVHALEQRTTELRASQQNVVDLQQNCANLDALQKETAAMLAERTNELAEAKGRIRDLERQLADEEMRHGQLQERHADLTSLQQNTANCLRASLSVIDTTRIGLQDRLASLKRSAPISVESDVI